MQKIKLIITAFVLVIIFHTATVLILGDSKIFACRIASVGGNGQLSEWRNDMCDLSYGNYIGSVQELTLNGNQVKIILVYVFPIIVALLVLFIFTRKSLNVYIKGTVAIVVVGMLIWFMYVLFKPAYSCCAVPPMIRSCPDEKIINKMPGSPQSSYYIKNGERREISDYEDQWVKLNCTVPEQVVN